MKKLKGFTLIELMVVIVIIGILATCAIPVYQTHVIRARVTEGMALGVAAKFFVSETLIRDNCRIQNTMGQGFVNPGATENVASVSIEKQSGNVIIQYTPVAGDGTIVLEPSCDSAGRVNWKCTGGSLQAKYRPANCK